MHDYSNPLLRFAENQVLLGEFEELQKTNEGLYDRIEKNTLRMRVISRKLGISTPIHITLTDTQAYEAALEQAKEDNNPIYDVFLQLQEIIVLQDKKIHDLKEEIKDLKTNNAVLVRTISEFELKNN